MIRKKISSWTFGCGRLSAVYLVRLPSLVSTVGVTRSEKTNRIVTGTNQYNYFNMNGKLCNIIFLVVIMILSTCVQSRFTIISLGSFAYGKRPLVTRMIPDCVFSPYLCLSPSPGFVSLSQLRTWISTGSYFGSVSGSGIESSLSFITEEREREYTVGFGIQSSSHLSIYLHCLQQTKAPAARWDLPPPPPDRPAVPWYRWEALPVVLFARPRGFGSVTVWRFVLLWTISSSIARPLLPTASLTLR